MTPARPPLWRQVLYGYGLRLDDRYLPWVTHDLAGRGAGPKMVARWAVPCLVLLAPFLVLPTDWVVKAMMTVPILLPYVYFSIALNRVYRRHRLAQHGLDPALVDARERARNLPAEQAYLAKYRGL
ncbi:DUF5313 family protein [uncultured Williamsia sp.]|uniref:DUF5313 family protein n=1 Tax=uncultured Williamsia sp. TaxID=259311 RepID=UPI0026189929|nr:DUF5313 family protein [uncultured Williamsia sp.]